MSVDAKIHQKMYVALMPHFTLPNPMKVYNDFTGHCWC